MSGAEPCQSLLNLLARARAEHPDAGSPAPGRAPDGAAILDEFLRSFLLWEASAARAEAALRRLRHGVVDLNEMRVCMTDELARILGERYPLGKERALRLRAALNEVYRREHVVTLQPLAEMPKREARMYLATLEGVPQFVAARVTLLALGGHAFPVDERIRGALVEGGVEEAKGGDVEALGSWLERQVHSGEARPAYLSLEAWLDAGARRAADARAGADERRKSKRA